MGSNKEKFYITLLHFFGIIFVVLAHTGGLSLFSDWFPYWSFHMPLFVFISGYLYKQEYEFNIKKYFVKRIKRLIIPLYIINFCYGILGIILRKNGIINYGSDFTLYNYFVAPWFGCNSYTLNGPMWFITQLFVVQMLYIFIRKAVSNLKSKEYLLLISFIFIGLMGVFVSYKGVGLAFDYKMLIVRTMFMMQFYHIGYFYKEKLEKYDKCNSLAYFSIIFIIQLIMITISKGNLYLDTAHNIYSSIIFLPLIVSLTGIFFWLRISKILEPILSENKILKYIGNNTWTIMCHHQFALFLFNFFLFKVSDILKLSSFSIERFKNDTWYTYSNGFNQTFIVSSIIIIALPLITKYIYDKYVKKQILNMITSIKKKI